MHNEKNRQSKVESVHQQRPQNDQPQNSPATASPSAASKQPLTSRQALIDQIAGKLSAGRQAIGESIDQPARLLKINPKHLRALERGDWQPLPGDVYVIGFLRQYSHYLHINLDLEIEQLKRSDYQLTKPLTFPDPPVAPSRQWAWIAGGAFLLLFALFNIFRPHSGDQPAMPETPGTPLQQATPQANDSASKQAPSTAIITPPAATLGDRPDSALAPATTAVEKQTADTRNTPTASLTAAVQSPASAQATTAGHSYRFEAVGEDVWLQIHEPGTHPGAPGKRLRSALLKAGHHVTLHNRLARLWVTCGNTPALRIEIDGQRVIDSSNPLGNGRKVVHNAEIHAPAVQQDKRSVR